MVIAQHHHNEKLKSGDEGRMIRHPLGIAAVIHASLICEVVEAAAFK